MRQRLDLRSAFLGIVFGALVSTLISKSRPIEHVAPWQLPPHPSEVYKQQLRQQIHQAVSEGWTLARLSPRHRATDQIDENTPTANEFLVEDNLSGNHPKTTRQL